MTGRRPPVVPGRCPVVVRADGFPAPWQDAGQPHHADLAGAVSEIADRLDGDLSDPARCYRPVQCAAPCPVVACGDCGLELADGEAGGTVHFPAGQRVDLAEFGWTENGDGWPCCGCRPPGHARPGTLPEPLPGPHDGPLPLQGLPVPTPAPATPSPVTLGWSGGRS